MVQIVPGHGFKLNLEREIATFRMVAAPLQIRLPQRSHQLQVPEARCTKDFKRGRKFITGVVLRPNILVERLETRWLIGWRGQYLPNAKAVHQFAVGEMRDDLARAPLAGCDGCRDPLGCERGRRLLKQTGSRSENGACVLRAKLGCIRIGHAPQ